MTGRGRHEAGAHWSLRRRLIGWTAMIVCTVWILGGGLVAWIAYDALQRELDALAVEEIAELTVDVLEAPLEQQDLESIADELDREHPEILLSLRAFRQADQEPWVEAGAPPRIPWPAGRLAKDEVTTKPGPVLRRRSQTISARLVTPAGGVSKTPLRIELLIDGQPRVEELKHVGTLCLIPALVGGVLAVLGGALFSQRLSRLLAQVGQSAATSRLDEAEEIHCPEHAPDEIRQVAEAFSETVREMRSEHSRNVLLTAGLAHELRSPLQNLISEAEVALLRERASEEYRELVAQQLEELRSLAMVVDNIITLTALRDTQHLPRQESFDFGAEIRMRLTQEASDAERRSVTLQVEEQGDVGLRGDREALVLMLRNLIGNAIRWTKPGTTVKTMLDGHSEELVVRVEDEGQGVPETEREAIFEAFYQGSTPAGSRAGYGLGLALARRAARSHGGDIEVGDTPTGGARFTVRLPRALTP